MAMLRRLPIMVLTWPMFSSISSSRASLVILSNTKKHKRHKAALAGRNRLSFLLGDVSAGGSDSVTIVHDSLRLIVDHFTVLVALPRSFIFFERRTSETGRHNNSR